MAERGLAVVRPVRGLGGLCVRIQHDSIGVGQRLVVRGGGGGRRRLFCIAADGVSIAAVRPALLHVRVSVAIEDIPILVKRIDVVQALLSQPMCVLRAVSDAADEAAQPSLGDRRDGRAKGLIDPLQHNPISAGGGARGVHDGAEQLLCERLGMSVEGEDALRTCRHNLSSSRRRRVVPTRLAHGARGIAHEGSDQGRKDRSRREALLLLTVP